MTHTLSAVFFDMGSTLSHQEPTREVVLSGFLQQQGHERSLHDVRRALLSADTDWHLWGQQSTPATRTDADRQAMRLNYRKVFLESLGLEYRDGLRESLNDLFQTSIMRRHNAVYSDVRPTLQAIRKRGMKLAIVSNWDNTLQSHCDDLGLTPLMDTIVGSFDVGIDKPDPGIFRIALERLGLAPDQVMHIGDMYVSDVVGARRAGILPVLLDRDDLEPDVDCLRVRALTDIPQLLGE